MTKKKMSKREEGWVYANIAFSILLWVAFGWRVGVIEFLAVGILANSVKITRGK